MTTRKYSSRSQQTTLTGAITAGATAMTVVSGTALLGGVTIPAGTTFTLVLDPDTALEEIVDATAVSTNTFTITRAIDGSTAQAHSAGGVVRHMAIGRDYRDANTHTEADSSYNDGSGSAHTLHGIAAGEGVVVGTLKTQTLTNKTLTSPLITDPTITGTAAAGASIVFEGATSDDYETTLTVVDPTQDNTITLPNTTGTVTINNATQTLSNKTLGNDLNAGGFKITNLATPTNASDAVRKDFADAQVAAAATSAASAATSASSAATSASSASTSASSALTSANSASASASAAATSAASAATSASTMAASVAAAATSAASAATSASSAATSATAAATSATSAAASATAAATSATSSASSATLAQNWATQLVTPVSGSDYSAKYNANLAATSATSAATSASSSATSATAAATSATSAAASATAAATSATSAAASATAAATSATSAAASATAAATSAASAAASATSVSSTATTAAELRQYGAEGSVLQNVPTRVHDAEQLLKQSVWWIDAAHSASSGQTIKNLGWGGSALDATAGSTTAADSNDPKYLDWDGRNYVYGTGTAGSALQIPDATNLRITGDIDLRAQVALDDWTPSTINGLITKWETATTKSYGLAIGTTGLLVFYYSADGTTTNTISSSVAPTVTDGTQLWVRVAVTANNGASGFDARFYTSNDGTTWTQLGTTQTVAGVLTMNSNASIINIGGFLSGGTTFPLAGKVFRAQILNGIDGVPVLDVDTSVITSGAATSFTALTGQTVTINRATSGRKTTCVVNPVWLFGTDDYMEVNNRWLERTTANYLYLPGVTSNYASAPDSAALDITGDIDLRAKVALDDWTPAATANLISKNQAGAPTYYLNVQTTGALRLMISLNGTTETIATSTAVNTISDGTTKWVRATRVASTGVVQFFTSDDGTTWTQLGADVSTTSGNIAATTAFLEIGTTGFGGGAGFRGKFFRAQVLNGIGGTVVFDANFETGITTNLPTTFTESSANAATVTINYSGTGYRSCGVIASTYVYPGNPNTFKLSTTSLLDFGATDDFTAIAVSRIFSTNANFGTFLMKGQAASNGGQRGYMVYNNGTAASITSLVSDGTNQSGTGNLAYTYGATTLFGIQRNVSTDQVVTLVNSTTTAVADITTGSLATPFALTIGSGSTVKGSYLDGEFVAAAIFRRALTAAEIASITTYYAGRVGA